MPIWIRTVDGRTEHVRSQQTREDLAELDSIIRGTGYPYSAGWIELESEQAHYVALRHVVSVEIRGRSADEVAGWSERSDADE